MMNDAYKKSGVDIDAATEAVERIKAHVRSTFIPGVVSDIGLFSGLFTIPELKEYKEPVFAFSTDGVGTKMMIAESMGIFDTVGQCLVNHCVNDILTSGAKPLIFLDYVASAKLTPEKLENIVKGIAVACREVGCALIGGETAEMPGVYRKDRHDLVGAIFGIVEREKVIDGSRIAEGDVLLGLPSNGLHTNGYSLVRRAIKTARLKLNQYIEELDCTLGEELLKIHKCYFSQVYPIVQRFNLGGIAHITGGGLIDNIARLLPDNLCAKIDCCWPIPPIFKMVQEIENVSWPEMRKVFNLGVGKVLIVPFEETGKVREALGENHWVIGEICLREEGEEKVVFF
ncbi:MAG: phosphoribosylformylglycinamidine cyclo-ligase [Candidatus Nealsonbacteria bacterium CG_4_10_14_0_2_um_filter_39_15]|uniref:Phosphoribosylformylglycinamidine cyclo-ligase n=1 Tax=Candidatus Nealsonbacteria bacterium CG_4_10_14_0_2_um_filter_39_15 TaxID=1974681 RepID=A0A2M7UWA3_9BACT|nr:MAG: phosphoribosylformylglycinamidine cyclo-ligase [Candidatus Nealsonbacteria bacterium CG_4_10_14_0_2_um_filter_39_15]